MIRAAYALLAAVALAFTPALGGAHGQDVQESPADLPEGEGRDLAFFACSACHGTAIIKAQGMSRERWSQTIDDMGVRGMAPLDATDREALLDYLEASFPPRRRAPVNPFLRP